jgi:hypothetical protein
MEKSIWTANLTLHKKKEGHYNGILCAQKDDDCLFHISINGGPVVKYRSELDESGKVWKGNLVALERPFVGKNGPPYFPKLECVGGDRDGYFLHVTAWPEICEKPKLKRK